MSNIPTTITRQQVIDAIKALGFDPNETSWTQIEPGKVLTIVHVEGHKYPRELMDAGILVPGHMVEIPVKDDDE